MIRLCAIAALIFAALGFTGPAHAHQQRITFTSVSHNPRTDLLEVVHRVPVHDAEHALVKLGRKAPDILNDLETRRAFARYVKSRFILAHEGKAIETRLLGTEIEGAMIVIYEDAASPGPGARISVQSGILTDVAARQENRVNMGTGTRVSTLIFRGGETAKRATLP